MSRATRSPERRRQRGEGKVGCVLALLFLAVATAAGAKILPYVWSVTRFRESAEELAGRAGLLTDEDILARLLARAQELEIPEALQPEAIKVQRQGNDHQGSFIIDVKFNRELDFYGAFSATWSTEKRINKPYVDAR